MWMGHMELLPYWELKTNNVLMIIYLFKWLLHVETRLGPDGTRLKEYLQANKNKQNKKPYT